MSDIDEIWCVFDQYLESIKVCKPAKTVRDFYCLCGGTKVVGPDKLPVCLKCGLVESMYIDDTPEWTSGVSEDGVSNDPSRCGNIASDPELFSMQWGTGTVINTFNAPAYAMRRLARINFHTSMNHKDRALFHAYKDIEYAAKDVLKLSDTVVRDAKVLYKKFNSKKLTRGAIRSGIKANCIMYACKFSKIPRTTQEIAEAFEISTSDVNRTDELFKEFLETKNTVAVTRSGDVVHRLLNTFSLGDDKNGIRIKCMKMCKKLDECTDLMSKTPSSIAAVIILLTLGPLTTRQEVCEKCSISMPTIIKIETIAKLYLEDSKV